jgi:hypothetical protein
MSMPVRPLPSPADIEGLVEKLQTLAEQDAGAVRATAAAEAVATERAAEHEARSVREEAQRTGARAAIRTAARRRAETRRQTRELVLATRRRVLDRLRAESVAILAANLDRPEGDELSHYLRTLVADVAGTPSTRESHGARGWVLIAPTSGGRAQLDLEDLVDQIIASLGKEVDSLWQ